MTLFKPTITTAAEIAVTAAPMIPTTALAKGLGDDSVLAASTCLHAEVTIAGMTRPFLPHQAAAYLCAVGSIARWGGAMLGDDMGLGKTQVLLALANDAAAAGRYTIMVAPPVAKAGYQDDLRAAFPALRFYHLQGRTAGPVPAADIYFISDDALTLKAWLTEGNDDKGKAIPSVLALGAGLVTRDEIHRDKGNQGKPSTRAKVMLAVSLALRERGTPIVGATGTILTNRPVEAFLPLQIIGGTELIKTITPGARSATGFMFRYCAPVNNGFGYTYNGCDMARMAELHDMLRRTVYVRREKADLGDKLPHSGWVIKPLALNGVLTRYKRIEREFLDLVREEEGPEAMWRKARAEAITRMQALWQEAGVAKAGASVEYIKDLFDQGREAIVVFYYHQDVFAALAKGISSMKVADNVTGKQVYPDVQIINGQVTGDRRRDAIHAFQNGTGPRVMLAQIRAAGMAVTLTGAAGAVFVQVPWSAGDLKQAADRILRADAISYQRALDGGTVTWHVLQAHHDNGDETFDAVMWSVLENKAMVCDAVNAGRQITMPQESIMHEALTAWYSARS